MQMLIFQEWKERILADGMFDDSDGEDESNWILDSHNA
jgi:hypothetical protein